MEAQDFMKRMEALINEADGLVSDGRFAEAECIYQTVTAIFRGIREKQLREVPGQRIPLTLRIERFYRAVSLFSEVYGRSSFTKFESNGSR